MNQKIGIIFLFVLFLLISAFGICKVTYSNRDISIRNMIDAKKEDNKNIYDSMWKIIKQQAQISEQYEESFKEIYPELIAGRYSSGGQMMKWIQESNPNFDTSLYKQLMVSIEAQRMRFAENQTRLLDYKREHDDLINRFPSRLFVSNDPVEIDIVLSKETEGIFSGDLEEDLNLF